MSEFAKDDFFNINILLNMSKEKDAVSVEKVEITGEKIRPSAHKMALNYLRAQQEVARENMKRYENNMPESELPESFVIKRQETRARYDTLVDVLSTISLFFGE